MNDDSIITSRTAWAALITAIGSQTELIKSLPTTMQVGIFAVACVYILGRSFQKGMALLAKKA